MPSALRPQSATDHFGFAWITVATTASASVNGMSSFAYAVSISA